MMYTALMVVLGLVATARGWGYSSSSGGSSNNCPSQVDFSAELLLSTDATAFPTAALNDELRMRPTLAACLFREIVAPTAPQVPVDQALVNAQDTCPHSSFMLGSYFRHNGRCWIVPALQEMVNFTVCQTQKCVGCSDGFFSGGGSETRCVRLYKYFSVWAFCEGLSLNSQLVRERIVLPFACNCQKVRCYASNFFWKK